MKLKHTILTAIMAFFAVSAGAVSADELKVYINPGHGSWGPNNRHCATIGHSPISTADPDTTDFFESNTNLVKCLAIFHRLCDYGLKNDGRNGLDLTQNVVMSRTKNGPYPYDSNDETTDSDNDYNRTLSEIAAEAETWGADMFISVHSNATTEASTTNYLYFAYDGYGSDADKNALSTEMSRCGWNHRILDRHTMWSHYDYTMTAADVAAGKGKIGAQKLGVMNHDIPGYLVEGYFHTYQPARHKAMNFDVDHIEGLTYARGVADYYGLTKESTGDIYGIVRDRHEKFSHELYTPNTGTYDKYLPLNGVEVTLRQGDTEVAKLTTDVNYNGAFVFKDVTPGDYTVTFSHESYKNDSVWTSDKAVEDVAKSIAVTVKAAEVTYPTAFLENVSYVPAKIVYVNYPDSTAGYTMPDEINFNQEYLNNAVAELAGKTIRRTIVRDSYEYVLALDANNAPYVYVFDTDSKTLVKTLGTSAASGDIYALSDIAMTADGHLVGINKANQPHFNTDSTHYIKVYKWENDENDVPDGELSVLLSTYNAGNWNNGIAGESMIYSGTLADGKVIYTGTTAAGTNTRLIIQDVVDGVAGGNMRNNQDGTYMSTKYLGETYKMTLSPRADDQIIFNSAQVQPFEIKLNESDTAVPTILAHLGDGVLDASVTGESYFKYAGRSLMAAPSVTDGNVDGVKLIDITDGLDAATTIVTGGTTITATAGTSVTANGELALTIDELTGMTTGADVELFLNIDGNISKFTTAGAKQPVYRGVYAYDLNLSSTEGTATVTFSLNDKSPNVDLVLTPVEGGEEVTYNLGALEAGENSYDVNLGELDGHYNWKIAVANKTISAGDILTTINTWGAGSTYYRGGVAVECNPESDHFGTTYLGVGRSKGVFLLDPTYQVKEGAPYWVGSFNTGNASSTFRGTLYNDKFYLTDWSDAYPGIWIFDPENPTEINNIFAGATNDGTGHLTIGGVAVGGGSTGVAFTGTGADRKMFIYVEDLPTGNAGNKLYRYDIGENDTWGAVAPTQLTTASAKLINTNTGLIGSALHNVVFCTQTRNADMNNTSVPAFIVIDEDGNIVFNGGDLSATLNGCLGGGMALNADETKFAIVDGSAAIQVYDVTWNGNVPAFTHNCSIATNDQEVCQMAFDYAGNLHCINRKHGYYVHTVPCEARTVETPAKASLVISSVTDGVENVETSEAEDAAPVYYNLNGVQVANPSNGIYIVKRGNKVTKEYIRK